MDFGRRSGYVEVSLIWKPFEVHPGAEGRDSRP
jgi:hypothetical protein